MLTLRLRGLSAANLFLSLYMRIPSDDVRKPLVDTYVKSNHNMGEGKSKTCYTLPLLFCAQLVQGDV